MSKLNIIAQPLSYVKIEDIAQAFRQRLGITKSYFPAEKIDIILDCLYGDNCVLDVDDTLKVEGFTPLHGKVIQLRDDVYNKLIDGNYRARFTALHEGGHKVLHCNDNAGLQRSSNSYDIKSFECPEWQANAFAGAVLCPVDMIEKSMGIQDMQDRFGISEPTARKRINIKNKYFSNM